MRLFFTLLIVCVVTLAEAQLVRGPYLNAGTTTGVVVRFRTQNECVPKVLVGNELQRLDMEYSAESGTEHEVFVTGLNPNSTYYYQCFCSGDNLTDIDESFRFKTLNPNEQDAVRAWVIGDFGRANEGQFQVRDGYKKYLERTSNEMDAWIWLGDNAYGDGTDEEYQNHVFTVYPEIFRNHIVYPSPGNHDYKSVDYLTHDGPYYQNFTMPTKGESGGLASNTENYYSYDIGDVHFVSLNSEWSPWLYVPPILSKEFSWLRRDLSQNTKKWVVAYWHQPPYTKGSHDSDDDLSIMSMMRANGARVLEEFGVDLVLCGHSHAYERSYLIKGHYTSSENFAPETHVVQKATGSYSGEDYFRKDVSGDNANTGTVYNVVGCSGVTTNDATMDHPIMYYNDNVNLGSLVLTIKPDTLIGEFIGIDGEVIEDYAIVKSEQATTVNDNKDLDLKDAYLAVYPNYEKRTILIESANPNPTEATLTIYDAQGKLVQMLLQNKPWNRGVRKHEYPLQPMPGGTYTVVLQLGKERLTQRFLLGN